MSKPVTEAIVKGAVNYRGEPTFGDGAFLDALMQILEKLLPFIMGCMPSKEAFIESAKEPTNWQERRLLAKSRRLARATRGLSWRDKRVVSEEAVNGLQAVAEGISESQLSACYDENTN